MIILVVMIFILAVLLGVAGWFLFTRKPPNCPICEDAAIMKLEYDVPTGQAPSRAISDFSSDDNKVKSQAGSNWGFLWGY